MENQNFYQITAGELMDHYQDKWRSETSNYKSVFEINKTSLQINTIFFATFFNLLVNTVRSYSNGAFKSLAVF